MRTTARWALALVLGWMLAASAGPGDGQGAAKKEVYSAVAAAGGGTGPVRQLRLYIDDYTTDEEAAQLAHALNTGGGSALLHAKRTMKKGRLVVPGKPSARVNIIRSRSAGNGRRLIMVLERPVSFFERHRGTRSTQYQFGIVQMQLDADGHGSGELLPAATFKFTDDRTIEIESFDIHPVRLSNIKPFH